MKRGFATLAGALVALSVNAQTEAPLMPASESRPPARIQAEVAAESSRLSNGSPDWRTLSLQIAHKRGARNLAELTLLDSSRFGLKDQQIGALIAAPVTDRLTATFAAQASPSHRVLARHGADVNLQYEFAPAWLLHTGAGFRRYNDADVTQASVMLEHYFSSFSAAAAWRPVRALNVSASSAELRGAWYYGEASSVALVLGMGQEAATVAASRVEVADVRSLALFGRHQIDPSWSLSYALGRTRQGNFYTQNSVRLGAQYVF